MRDTRHQISPADRRSLPAPAAPAAAGRSGPSVGSRPSSANPLRPVRLEAPQARRAGIPVRGSSFVPRPGRTGHAGPASAAGLRRWPRGLRCLPPRAGTPPTAAVSASRRRDRNRTEPRPPASPCPLPDVRVPARRGTGWEAILSVPSCFRTSRPHRGSQASSPRRQAAAVRHRAGPDRQPAGEADPP